jgi:hypothetical protein
MHRGERYGLVNIYIESDELSEGVREILTGRFYAKM